MADSEGVRCFRRQRRIRGPRWNPGPTEPIPCSTPGGAEVMSTRAVVLIVVGVTVAAFAGVALVALIVAA